MENPAQQNVDAIDTSQSYVEEAAESRHSTWWYTKDKENDRWIISSAGGEIASCISEQDAKLIASAPELLEAIRGMVAYRFGEEGWNEQLDRYAQIARFALKKATGS